MASTLGSSLVRNGIQSRKATSVYAGRRVMSEKQAQAYLVAREPLRRIQRTSSHDPHRRPAV